MATRAYLVRSILHELGIWQSGQDLPPEDYQAVDEDLEYLLEAMARAEVYAVDDVDSDVPDAAVSEIARYLAGEYTQKFGISGDELQVIMRRAGLAEGALRFQRTRRPSYVPMRGQYF